MSQLSTASSGSLSSTLGSTGTVAPLERIGDYQIGEKLGKGAYGVVYKGLNLENGDFVAIKVLSTKGIPESQIESLKKEVTFLQKLRHKHIVKYVSNYSTDDHYYIMLEFVESGSLSGVIKRYGKLPENLVAVYMWQVLKGLKYLHRKGVIHRDIKGANILCTKESYIKLADFGVATKLSALDIQSRPKSSSSSESPSEVVGTPYWMAPEVIELNPPTFASDIWSVGCTVIELMTGRPPYYELNSMSALFRIVSDEMPPLPENISELGRDFLLRCFIKDPNARESAKQLLKHKWIRMAKKRVKRKQRMMEEAEADMDEFDDIEGYYDDDDEEYYDDDDEEDDDDDSDEDDEDEESEEEDEDEEEGEEEEGDESGSEEEEEEGEDPNAEAEEDNDEESEEEEEEEGADNPEEAEEQEEEDEQDEEQEDEEENSKYATAQEGTLPPPASST